MYKALKKQKKATPLIEQNELKKLCLRYLMRRTADFPKGKNLSVESFLILKEILQELYGARSRSSSLSRHIKVCPITGRTRGYYNFAKLSRIQFKELAGRGLLPGFRKSS